MADITLERIAELEMLRAAVGRALEAYSASNRDEALALNHDGANLVYMANLANSAPALLEAARRLLELEAASEFLAQSDRRVCLVVDYRAPGESTYGCRARALPQVAQLLGWQPPTTQRGER